MTTIIIIGIIIVIAFIFIGFYNSLVKAKQKVLEGRATIEVYLKKRFDLIPNLVETVKGYANHEKATLENVVKARSAITTVSDNFEERIKKENTLTQSLRSLFAVAESYPDLKANTNFMNLQNQLTTIEEDIASSRKYYNAVVREYNTLVLTFPRNIIAGMFNFKTESMFEVDSQEEKVAPKVNF